LKIKTLLLAALIASGFGTINAADVKPFQFIQISDPHITAADTTQSLLLQQAFDDMNKNYPDAAFVINCGDTTEMGYKEEYAHFKEIIGKFGKPVYSTIGNHDVRWSENGKENYRDAFGDTYRTFDYNGVRFVSMDVSMLLEHYGHFDGEKMNRLKKDLESLKENQPMIISFHQPILAGGGFVDNDFVFAEAIRPYNVPLVMEGHGHTLEMKTVNDTTYAMGGSTFGVSAYRVWTIGDEYITGTVRKFRDNTSEVTTTFPLVKKQSAQKPVLKVETDQCTSQTTVFTYKSEGFKDGMKLLYSIDNAYNGEAIAKGNDLWQTKEHSLPVGIHQLVISYETGKKQKQASMVSFTTTSKDKASPVLLTKVMQLGSGAQSSPTINGDDLYVGCNDGKLYCFDIKSDKEKWTTDLKREIVGKPIVFNKNIYVGSMSKDYYCISTKDGSIVWKTPVGGAVLGTLLVTDELVVGGSGDGGVHALDRVTGKEVWKYQTGKYVKMKPCLADGGKSILFAGWDNKIVKVEAATGKEIWSVEAAASVHVSCATADLAVSDTDGIVIANTHDYKVSGLSLEDGKTLWKWTPPTKPEKRLGPSYSSPIIKDGISYCGSIDGYILGFNIKTGELVTDIRLREEKTDEIFDSASIIVGNKLYVGSIGGNVYCVDLEKKSVDWSVSLAPGFILTSPAFKNGKLYVSSVNNAVYTIQTPKAENK